MKTLLRLFVLLGFILIVPGICSFSQVGINTDNSLPDNSAMLDVKSTSKGILPPRMTFDERNAIVSPHEGLMVYCTNCNADGTGLLSIYQGGKWQNILLNCTTPVPPTAGTHVPDVTQITWNWNTVPIAFGYKWNTVDNFSTATDAGTSTSHLETGLTCWTTYTRYVWAYNACGNSTACVLTQATLPVDVPAPTAGTQIPSICQIEWHWNAVSGATGYKANLTNVYDSAGDMGNVTTGTEFNLTPNTAYSVYVWAYNSCGHSASTMLSSQTLPGFCIGESYGGGIIFYLDGTGHGLISATSDQSTGAQWGCSGTSIGTSTGIGTGQANTTAIVNGCSDIGIAAKICDDLVLNTYSDWFLPSKDELNEMFLQASVIGGFAGTFYWSSSEYSATNAWEQEFANGGGQYSNPSKNGSIRVRAIRAF